MNPLDEFKSRLSFVRPGKWHACLLADWLIPLLPLFEEAGRWIPTTPRLNIFPGYENHCLEVALAYATLHPTSTPFLGVGYFEDDKEGPIWWPHCCCFEAGAFIDPARIPTQLFFGIPFSPEVWERLPRMGPRPQSLPQEKPTDLPLAISRRGTIEVV